MEITETEYIKITELDNGDLKLELTDEGRELIAETQKNGYKDIWWELFEDTATNGSYAPHNPADTGDLTDAPMIINERTYEGDGAEDNFVWDENYHKRWYYADYQILDEFEQLAEHGEITLTLVR